jgi:hypothetical protein
MEKTIEAVFDGKVFHPEGKVDLEPNRPYVLTVSEKIVNSEASDAWSILGSLTGTVDAPEDWAQEHDHYLYGVSKRNKGRS